MGKFQNKPRQANRNHHDSSGIKKNFSGHNRPKKLVQGKASKTVRPVVPFQRSDHILLVGEGDFSFALSLIEHHKCKYVTATCYDSDVTLYQKYPHTHEMLEKFLTHSKKHHVEDNRILGPTEDLSLISRETREHADEADISSSEWEGVSPSASSDEVHPITNSRSTVTYESSMRSHNTSANNYVSFHTSVSAHNLQKCKPIRRKAPFNKIVFNFPHVGGLSTDVNRQVRANQELLVGFFNSCKPLLASKMNPVTPGQWLASDESDLEEEYDDLNSNQTQKEAEGAHVSGQVIVSLFDGEPYSLWNIRDLARHSGFRVVTSWRFPWDAYPGYRHARTIGQIVRKTNAKEADGSDGIGHKKGGGWKGEEREARGFVFEMVGEEQRAGGRPRKESPRSKRRRSISSDGSNV